MGGGEGVDTAPIMVRELYTGIYGFSNDFSMDVLFEWLIGNLN